MRKELIFNNGNNNYNVNKYYFEKDKKNLININEADINKIFLSNKAPYGEQGCYKYYIGYLGGIGFKPLHILIKKTKLYASCMNVLADNDKLLKYIKIWNKFETLFNKKI